MKDILGILVLSWPLTLLVLIVITFLVIVPMAVRYAKKHGRSKWRWGIGAFLLVYLPIFWDWIPTVVVHKYYCEKEAGFWVYKTLDQWKAENPGVMKGLVSYNRNPGGFNVDWPSQHIQSHDAQQITKTYHINEHFNLINRWQEVQETFSILREENVLFDIKNNNAVARYINFKAGYSISNKVGLWKSLKFWLESKSCSDGIEKQNMFGKFYMQFRGVE